MEKFSFGFKIKSFQPNIGGKNSIAYLENKEDGHNKFYYLAMGETPDNYLKSSKAKPYVVELHYGKIGSSGTIKQMYFDNKAEATSYYLERIDLKTDVKKGYKRLKKPTNPYKSYNSIFLNK